MNFLSNSRVLSYKNSSTLYRRKRNFSATKRSFDWSNRMQAIENLHKKKPVESKEWLSNSSPIENFAVDVFADKQLREKLPQSSYDRFREVVDKGAPLEASIADQIATAMKEWAMARGATHFTHWFQPLHGTTAEKHDSFLTVSGRTYNKKIIMNFAGKELIKGEPDASSFPSGGLRTTFEARGYTAWDMSSPSFIKRGANGSFLCIPTAFCSWSGDSLDTKTPLLRSNEALSKEATRLLHLLGEKNVTSVSSELGIEQEFFLIDRGFYYARPDLISCGRTLLGAKPPKGQELEDHYFGSVDRRVLAFVQEAEWTLWKLGVPMKTRHNEVAPSQYEMAPIFEDVAVASDHNMLSMEILRELAVNHGFACLLHEKPFAGINGSGKHNNWSMSTNTGENLTDPGDTPAKNARFMVILTAILRAIHKNGDLLRLSVTVPGNDHRLGSNEAPPAIMSVFIGQQLEKVLQDIISSPPDSESVVVEISKGSQRMKLGVNALPSLPRDTTDRNRTSPVAFTGNKFEFRAVGSSQNSARPGTMMNTIVAESLNYISNELENEMKNGKSRENAIQSVVQKTLKESQVGYFNGNGYSEDWIKEASKRGLFNLRTAPEAIQQLDSQKNLKVLTSMKVLSEREISATKEVLYENYCKALNVEAQCLSTMISTGVLPAALTYQNTVGSVTSFSGSKDLKGYSMSLNSLTSELISRTQRLKEKLTEVEKFDEHHLHERASFFRGEVTDAMNKTREISDELEGIVDNRLWPFPKYSEMLFMK